jgi:hypothetical protein
MPKKLIKTENTTDVSAAARLVADNFCNKHLDSGDLKAGREAIRAYCAAISAEKTRYLYKRDIGELSRIPFFD